jgi:hypothetical protein
MNVQLIKSFSKSCFLFSYVRLVSLYFLDLFPVGKCLLYFVDILIFSFGKADKFCGYLR